MPLENSAHRFALDRAVARVNAYDDLPRARHPRSHASVTMRPTDFCQPLCFLNLYPCSLFPTLLRPARIFEVRLVRSEGPSFHDALDPLRWAMRQRGGVFALASRAGLPLALTLVVSLRSRLHL